MSLGCGVGPKHFRSLLDNSPLTRARAVGMGRELPDSVVMPALIERLNDKDPVVRLSASEELRRRTGQDFGFVAWADAAERKPAVERWQAWWKARQAGLANSRKIP